MRLNLNFSVDKCELFQAKLHFSKQKLLFSNPFRRVQIGRDCAKNHGGTPSNIVDKFMRLNMDFSVDKCELFQAKLIFSKQK
jgi:hypothetical protein